jgi:glutamyl-tRNA synthetase
MADKVVTRFAPSPTGFMHVGGVRTALYAWLFARQNAGTFILRIEDTDKEREVQGSLEHIIKSLTWLGIDWQEGPDIGGPNAPYLQSKRLASYKQYAEKLIAKGLAYPDPYTESQVEVFRKKAEDAKKPFLYRDHRPETFGVWDGTQPLRFKVPEVKRYTWQDLVRGELTAGEEALDDFILLKSDGYPTYNFAHIIDDLEMGVTHIMRGEEFISSTPKFLSLYDALEITPPQLATMPVILNPDGNKKLGKRDGAKDILDYKSEGFLPETMLNFLALLGWHPEGDREVLTVDDLTQLFDITRIQKGGAKFDEVKLKWFNHEHIKMLSPLEFETRLKEFLLSHDEKTPDYLIDIAPILKNSASTFGEAAETLRVGEFNFMEKDIPIDPLLLVQGAKAEGSAIVTHLKKTISLLEDLNEPFTPESVKEAIFPYATEVGRAGVLWPMRVALSGKEKSPDPFILASLLGKEVTLKRLSNALLLL